MTGDLSCRGGAEGTPVPLRRHLHPGRVDTAAETGWSELGNGELLAAAEGGGFDLLIITDQNLRYQQNRWTAKTWPQDRGEDRHPACHGRRASSLSFQGLRKISNRSEQRK